MTISSPLGEFQVPRVSKECWVSVHMFFLLDISFPLFSTNPVQPNTQPHKNWSKLRGSFLKITEWLKVSKAVDLLGL